MSSDNYIILIPAYNPDRKLIELINLLKKSGLLSILVVNDGSHLETKPFFDEIESMGVPVLEHAINLGKGAALKFGFNHIYTKYPYVQFIITADADGQHCVEDIQKLIDKSEKNHLVLGVRSFDKNVPLRSKFGNLLTKKITHFFVGVKIKDTQTGLRSIPRALIPNILRLKTNRYDFEFDMLLCSIESGFPIKEVPIQTIYLDNNKSSHFNPIVDSMKIYFILIRFIGVSFITALIDFICFYLFLFLSQNIALAQLMARVIAGIFNYNVNKKAVFRVKGQKDYYGFFYYFLLVALHGCISYSIISVMVMSTHVLLAKCFAETILFFMSFFIQRFFIFNPKETRMESA